MTASPKASADQILYARWLIPIEPAGLVLQNQALVINNGKIEAIDDAQRIDMRFESAQCTHLDSHVVMPGLINAHCHGPMSLLKGYADDLPLQPWLEEKIWPAEARWVSESFVADGARLAIAEMLLTGTTTYSDMYFFPDQIATVVSESGIRAQLACPILDFPTIWAQNADEYIAKTTSLHDKYRNSERISIAFGPHAPYTVSDEPLQKIAMLAEELDLGIHMHIHENAQEIVDALKNTAKRPLTRLAELDVLGPRMQAVHMTQLLDEEIEQLAAQGVHIIHCPASNMKLASGFCRIKELLAAGVNVALGSDGSATNNNLDMFAEMRLASLLCKGFSGDAAALPAWQALSMATINGARALGMEQLTGSLVPGKYADIIAVNIEQISSMPVYDPLSTLVFSVNSKQVSHSWVQGQMLVKEGQLTKMNQTQIIARSHEWNQKIASESQS